MRLWAAYIAAVIITTFTIWKAVTEYIQIKIGMR
jgi:hypothetical protein